MAQIAVPNVQTQAELAYIMQQSGAFAEKDVNRVIKEIEDATGGKQIGVGVQTVLTGIQTARQDPDHAGRFVELLSEAVAENRFS